MTKNFILEIKNKLTETEGSALMAVVILFLVMMILVGTGSTLALSNYKKSKAAKENHSAYYLAESQIKEFSDKMLEQLSNLSSSDKQKYSKFTKEEMASAINAAVIPNLRTQPSIMNQLTKASSVELIPSTTEEDSYTIKSRAVIDSEERKLNQNVKHIIKSFQTGVSDSPVGGNDEGQKYGFIDKYGLVVKESFDLTETKIKGNMFFMNENFEKKDAKITSKLEFKEREGKETFFYSSMSKSPQDVLNSMSLTKWSVEPLTIEKIKSNEPVISEKQLIFPKVPDKNNMTTQRISQNQIKKVANPVEGSWNGVNHIFKKSENGDVSLEWREGSGLIDLSNSDSNDYHFKKLHVKLFYNTSYNSLLYIDVGDKDVHFIVDDFYVEGGLLVLGEGSLTIHTSTDSVMTNEYNFKPALLMGVDTFLHDSTKGNPLVKVQPKNNIVLSIQGDKTVNINIQNLGNTQMHASFIANNVIFDKPWGAKSSISILSIGQNSTKKQSIKIPNNGTSDIPVFIYAPYADMWSQQSYFKGFIFVKSLLDTGGGNSTIDHEFTFIESLPPSVLYVINQIRGVENNPENENGNGDDAGLEYKKIEFESIREVAP